MFMDSHNTSEVLLQGMRAALDAWAAQEGGQSRSLYWILRLQMASHGFAGGVTVAEVQQQIPAAIADRVMAKQRQCDEYWSDIRYASLEPVTRLWGTVVNGVRVASESDRATEVQKRVFDFHPDALVDFFRAARERMEVADRLYHAFKPMPAPECQALAALLNVDVAGRLTADVVRRLVRLLDHEGPMSEEEQEALSSLSATNLVDAAFSGLRLHA
jgi:hypothetical protein